MVLMGFWCTKQSEAIVCRVKRREGKMGFFLGGVGGREWVWLGREKVFMRKRLWFWWGPQSRQKERRLANGKERREVEEKQLQLQRIEKIVCYCWLVLLS